jgi:formylglycine-generating enzyme required for sulfatase activity
MFLNYEGLIPGFTEITGAIGSAIGATPSVKAFLEIWLKILYFSAILGIWRAIASKEKKSPDADTSEKKCSGSQKKGFWFGVLTAGIIFLVLAFSGEFLEILRSNKTPGFSQEKTVQSPELPRSSYSGSPERPAPNIGPKEGQKWIADLGSGVKMEFMPIKAGSFMMGSENGASDEKPVHRATLTKPFWMAKTEVTQLQYQQVMGSNPSTFQGLENPVEKVSWNDAVSFCKALTDLERRAGRLPEGFEYTLPTEAQWEYACRAGTTGDYAGSLDSMAWYSSNSGDKTHPVGQKQPNAWGLYDMHGNVGECCLDQCDYSEGVKTDTYRDGVVDPLCRTGPDRVIRGGSMLWGSSNCRSAHRGIYIGWAGAGPDGLYMGFRPLVQQK